MTGRVFVSPVGTSMLTNGASSDLISVLKDTANLRAEDIEPSQRMAIDGLAKVVKDRLCQADLTEVWRFSAELNGIYSYCKPDRAQGAFRGDQHWLIATDTYQGRITAEIVADHLRELGAVVSIFVPPGLSTRDRATFSSAITTIVRWCEDTLPGYRDSGYRVIFNLVGGFKGVQGYLNTLGMFYADEIVYIFETGSLIRIPRLPVRLDDLQVFRDKPSLFARMASDNPHLASRAEVEGIPEAFLEMDGEHALLNEWGQLLWARQKAAVLGEGDLLVLPGLVYGERFRRDFAGWENREERVKLQETLVKVSCLWEKGGLAALRGDGGIQYETYENRGKIGHFRVTQGLRVSCEPRRDILFLRRFGAHDPINKDP